MPFEAWIDSLGLEFNKLLVDLSIKRLGLGFYALRHTFETIGGESKDQVAVNSIMGHAPAGNDMSAKYRERVTDERLKAATEHRESGSSHPKPGPDRKSGSK